MEQYSVLSSCWLPWYERTDERHEKFDFSGRIWLIDSLQTVAKVRAPSRRAGSLFLSGAKFFQPD